MRLISKEDFLSNKEEIFRSLEEKYPGVLLVHQDHIGSIGISKDVHLDEFIDDQKAKELISRANRNYGPGYRVYDPMHSSPELTMEADHFIYKHGFVLEQLEAVLSNFQYSISRLEQFLKHFKIPYRKSDFRHEQDQEQGEI